MAKKQDVKIDDLVTIKPITDNQEAVFNAYKKDKKIYSCMVQLELEKLSYHSFLH